VDLLSYFNVTTMSAMESQGQKIPNDQINVFSDVFEGYRHTREGGAVTTTSDILVMKIFLVLVLV